MVRPSRKPTGSHRKVALLIPARNEAVNLQGLLPLLTPQAPVFVFDDESDDGTGDVAARLGAVVIRPKETLPKGWTGKNRGCHELARAASQTDAEWFCFLDADVRTSEDFVKSLQEFLQNDKRVLTGFPTIQPGQGVEPLFLAWVGWILLSTNPFGMVSRTKMGHNRFTNGQFHVWPRDIYLRLMPNESVKGHVLEDVMMGRLLAKNGVPVEVLNASSILTVKMYDTWRETLDGMSKNSFEITGNILGSYMVALFLLFLAWAWVWSPSAYLLLSFSGLACALTVRAKPVGVVLSVLTMPIALTIGAYTMVRSVAWRVKGKVTWKGRTY